MLEVADIIRLHGAAYREQFGETLSSVQKQALRDIAATTDTTIKAVERLLARGRDALAPLLADLSEK